MATIELSADLRTATGKGAARKIRQAGQVPATVYRNGDEATLIQIDPQALQLGFERTKNPNTLVNLAFGDESKVCLVKEVQRHPVSGKIRHVDFYNVHDDQTITVNVPVKTVGKAKGVSLGGKLRIIRRSMTVQCTPANIPSHIEVDVSDVGVGEFLKASKITPPENYTLVLPSDFNVVTVIRRRGSKK
jgi:large subunit ribosomal protein L25